MNMPGFAGTSSLYKSPSIYVANKNSRTEKGQIIPSVIFYRDYWKGLPKWLGGEGIWQSSNGNVRVRKVFRYCGSRFDGPHATSGEASKARLAAQSGWRNLLMSSYLDRFNVRDISTEYSGASPVNLSNWIRHFGGDMYCSNKRYHRNLIPPRYDWRRGWRPGYWDFVLSATVCADMIADTFCPKDAIEKEFGSNINNINENEFKRLLHGQFGCHGDKRSTTRKIYRGGCA